LVDFYEKLKESIEQLELKNKPRSLFLIVMSSKFPKVACITSNKAVEFLEEEAEYKIRQENGAAAQKE
jgi:hypothetical protein